MHKNRLEAFSDGVIAIIITIMVLEMKIPHGGKLSDLKPILPVFLSYVLSFVYVGIYWNNHHHMLHITERVNGKILWANLALLFSLSLFPFVTGWIGENHVDAWPVALYGAVLMMGGLTWYILARCLVQAHGKDSLLYKAYGADTKTLGSILIYLVGILMGFWQPWAGIAMYAAVAVVWIIPDKRVERKLSRDWKK